MNFATLPRIQHRRLQTSTSQSAKSLRLPREMHRFGTSSNPPRLPTFLQPSRTPAPATYSATCRNPCACHAKTTLNVKKRPEHLVFWRFWLPNRCRAQAWCKFWRLQLAKVLRTFQFLTILISKSFSRAGVVQILATSTSKSAPIMPVFNDFDFQIAVARRRGANFVTSWATDPPHPPILRTWLFEPAKPQNYGKTQHFAHFLPAKSSCRTSLLYHICAITSLDWQIFSSNFQYSRKLDSKTSFDGGLKLPPIGWIDYCNQHVYLHQMSYLRCGRVMK